MLMDEPLPEPESMATKWEAFALQYGPEGVVRLTLRQAWEEHREDVLAEWTKKHPGTRPSAWWQWDAPEDAPSNRETQAAYLRRHGLLLPNEQCAPTDAESG